MRFPVSLLLRFLFWFVPFFFRFSLFLFSSPPLSPFVVPVVFVVRGLAVVPVEFTFTDVALLF